VSLECIEKILANNVENPGERQLCAINPNLSWQRKQKKIWKTTLKWCRMVITVCLLAILNFPIIFLSTIQTKDDTHYKLQKK